MGRVEDEAWILEVFETVCCRLNERETGRVGDCTMGQGVNGTGFGRKSERIIEGKLN